MAVTSNDSIKAADYNGLQSRIADLLGTGSNEFGYGQGVTSSQVTAITDPTVPDGDSVTVTQINNLLSDFDTVYTHQNGSSIFISSFSEGDIIGADESGTDIIYNENGDISIVNQDDNKGFNDFLSEITNLEDNKFQIANNQILSQIIINDKRERDWTDTVDSEFTVTFGSANDRRYFFNSGGAITFEGSVDLSTSTGDSLSRDSGWKDIIENVSEVSFRAIDVIDTGNASGVSFPDGNIGNYQITETYQTIFRKDANSGLYSNSFWEIQARENSASEIQFLIELVNRGPESNPDEGDAGSESDGIRELVTADINFQYGFKKADQAVVVSQPTLASINTFDPNPNELFIAVPSNQSPSNNEVVNTNLGVTLSASAFDSINGSDTHERSQWILRKVSDETIIINDDTTSQLTSYTIDASVFDDVRGTNADYEWQVRYKGSNTDWTPWSSATGFTTSVYAEFDITLSSDTESYILSDKIRDNFNWNGTQQLEGSLTIASGVVIGSTNTSSYALTVDSIPSGSNITLQNNGRITGAGGKGGRADRTPNNGANGGPALRTTASITVQNSNGVIAGGGGGGGAGYHITGASSQNEYFASGGGGAGFYPGARGDALIDAPGGTDLGNDGATTSGGAGGSVDSASGGQGGNPGQSGSNGSGNSGSSSGGSPGDAIVGISNITFASGSGNVVGPTS